MNAVFPLYGIIDIDLVAKLYVIEWQYEMLLGGTATCYFPFVIAHQCSMYSVFKLG